MLVKIYGNDTPAKEASHRYSPSSFAGAEKQAIYGNPRRFNVLRGAPEPDPYTHAPLHSPDECIQQEVDEPYACNPPALHILQLLPHPCLIHKTLCVTSAMEGCIVDYVWSVEEVVMMAEAMRKNVVTETESN